MPTGSRVGDGDTPSSDVLSSDAPVGSAEHTEKKHLITDFVRTAYLVPDTRLDFEIFDQLYNFAFQISLHFVVLPSFTCYL